MFVNLFNVSRETLLIFIHNFQTFQGYNCIEIHTTFQI